MTREQAILVMQALYAFLKTEIHPDANQDPWVFKMMNTLDDLCVTGLQVMFEGRRLRSRSREGGSMSITLYSKFRRQNLRRAWDFAG